jgi:hypothetical protein
MFLVSKTLSGYLLNLPRYWLADNLVSVMPLRKKLIMNTPHVTLKPIKAEVQIRLISGLLKIAYNPTAEKEATRVLISKQTFPCVAYKVRLNISASYILIFGFQTDGKLRPNTCWLLAQRRMDKQRKNTYGKIKLSLPWPISNYDLSVRLR